MKVDHTNPHEGRMRCQLTDRDIKIFTVTDLFAVLKMESATIRLLWHFA